jgi:hypothetical protein
VKIRNLVSQLVLAGTVGKKPTRHKPESNQPVRVSRPLKERKRELARILAEKKAGLR